jgi:hypothetical protein
LTIVIRYAYDNIGVVFFGKQFGFMQHRVDFGNYIHAVHQAMPLLSVVSHALRYIRPLLLVGAAFVPRLLRAILSVQGIRRTAVRETKRSMAKGDKTEKFDVLSQLLTIVKSGKAGLSQREVESEMWTGIMAGADSTAVGPQICAA